MEVVLPSTEVAVLLLTPHPTVPCLYSGVVERHPTSSLVAVAGCRGQEEQVTVTIAAPTLPTGLATLVMEGGATREVEGEGRRARREAGDCEEGDCDDWDYEQDWGVQFDLPEDPFPLDLDEELVMPKAATYKVALKYDNQLLAKFGGDHQAARRWVTRVITQTEPRLLNLKVPISLQVLGEPQHLEETIDMPTPTDALRTLQHLERSHFKEDDFTTHIFFTNTRGKKIHGATFSGIGCQQLTRRLGSASISSHYSTKDDLLNSAATTAHEIGHTLGMR